MFTYPNVSHLQNHFLRASIKADTPPPSVLAWKAKLLPWGYSGFWGAGTQGFSLEWEERGRQEEGQEGGDAGRGQTGE